MGGIISEAAFEVIHEIDAAIGVSSGAARNRGRVWRKNETRPLLHYHGIFDSTIPPCVNNAWIANQLFPDLGLKAGHNISSLSIQPQQTFSSDWVEEPWMKVVNQSLKPDCKDVRGNDVCLSSDFYMYESLQTLVERYNAGLPTKRIEDMMWKRMPLSSKFNLSESTFGANIACTNITTVIRVCLVDTNHLLPYMRPFSTLRFVQGSVGRLVYVEAILTWLLEHNL